MHDQLIEKRLAHDQLIEKLLCTVTVPPLNGGTWAARNRAATQPPTDVPANGGPSTLAVVAFPLGANVTETRPEPVGPSGFLQPDAALAAELSADIAAARSNGAPSAAGAAGVAAGAGVAPAAAAATAAAEGVLDFSFAAVFSGFSAFSVLLPRCGVLPGATAAGSVGPLSFSSGLSFAAPAWSSQPPWQARSSSRRPWPVPSR